MTAWAGVLHLVEEAVDRATTTAEDPDRGYSPIEPIELPEVVPTSAERAELDELLLAMNDMTSLLRDRQMALAEELLVLKRMRKAVQRYH